MGTGGSERKRVRRDLHTISLSLIGFIDPQALNFLEKKRPFLCLLSSDGFLKTRTHTLALFLRLLQFNHFSSFILIKHLLRLARNSWNQWRLHFPQLPPLLLQLSPKPLPISLTTILPLFIGSPFASLLHPSSAFAPRFYFFFLFSFSKKCWFQAELLLLFFCWFLFLILPIRDSTGSNELLLKCVEGKGFCELKLVWR